MSYLDRGTGDAVVFLYGNSTAAFLWRNVIPYVSAKHRAIAPDLICLGDETLFDSAVINEFLDEVT